MLNGSAQSWVVLSRVPVIPADISVEEYVVPVRAQRRVMQALGPRILAPKPLLARVRKLFGLKPSPLEATHRWDPDREVLLVLEGNGQVRVIQKVPN